MKCGNPLCRGCITDEIDAHLSMGAALYIRELRGATSCWRNFPERIHRAVRRAFPTVTLLAAYRALSARS